MVRVPGDGTRWWLCRLGRWLVWDTNKVLVGGIRFFCYLIGGLLQISAFVDCLRLIRSEVSM